jgi:glycosyltransferase involved in cell wall biosynthesis
MISNEDELRKHYGEIATPRMRAMRTRSAPIFDSNDAEIDLRELADQAGLWFSRCGLPPELVRAIQQNNRQQRDMTVFALGSYGKVGTTKGSYDLLRALARLADAGLEFVFLTASCGHADVLRKYYETIMRSAALAQRTILLPPVAPWRIPGFVRRCDAVCFLERDFPIHFHGPAVPREILAAGRCLVCSAEVARKRPYAGALVDERNAVVIADPTDEKALASRLKRLIEDRDGAAGIGRQGRKLVAFWNQELPTIDDQGQEIVSDIARLSAVARRSDPGGGAVASAGRRR